MLKKISQFLSDFTKIECYECGEIASCKLRYRGTDAYREYRCEKCELAFKIQCKEYSKKEEMERKKEQITWRIERNSILKSAELKQGEKGE